MKICDSISELESYLESELKDLLYNEIGDEVDHAIQRHAESDVYGAYNPVLYRRRGLLRSGKYYEHYPDDLSLTVLDVTPGDTPIGQGYTPSGTDLSNIIQTGAQGHGYGKWLDAFARPYIDNAVPDIESAAVELIEKKFN